MERTAAPGIVYRFGLFEANPVDGMLSRGGTKVKIQEQPFRLLLLLLQRPGKVVSREELRQKLWPEGTYVDFDGSLNVILKRLRAAIDDDPDNPRFIETVPRRGYRFIAPVSVIERASDNKGLPQVPATNEVPVPPITPDTPTTLSAAAIALSERAKQRRRYLLYARSMLAALIIAAGGWLAWHSKWMGDRQQVLQNTPVHVRKSVAVLGFRNLSGRTKDAWLATAMSEMLSTELAGGEKIRLVSGEEVANLRLSSPWSQTDTLVRSTAARISTALNSDVLVLGSYSTAGPTDQSQLRLDVRMQDGKTGEILTEVAEVGGRQDLFHLVSGIGTKLRARLGIQELQSTEEAGVLASLPLDPEAARFYALGVAKLREFDALAAKDLLEQAAEDDPRFSLVHSMLARAWAELGYEQKRREEAKKALDLALDLPSAQRMLVEGEYYESLGKPEQASSVYHALFELFPDNLDYGLRLVAAQTLSGHSSQAMEAIHQLRRLPPPSSEDPRIDLAEKRAMKSNNPAELALVRSAIRKASERGQKLIYALAKKEECTILNYGEHPDQALPACEEAYNVFLAAGNKSAAADALRNIADTQGTLGKFQEAIATYGRAQNLLEGLGEHNKIGAVFNNMAIGYENMGNLDRAEHLYRAAKVEFEQAGDVTNQFTVTGNIADIFYLRGNLAGADKLYQEALRIAASADITEPYLLYRVADLDLTRGRVQDARQLAQQAVEALQATQGSYQYLNAAMLVLGEVLQAQGDLAGARSQFEGALAIAQKIGASFSAAESQEELADLAIEENHPTQAEALLRSAIADFEKEKSDPDSSSAYTSLSRTLLMQGKLSEARTAAQRGFDLSLTSSDPALKLVAEIQQARVEAARAETEKKRSEAALGRLQSVIATASRLGYYRLDCEARLELGKLELKLNPSPGHQHLNALALEARSRGLELVARQAEDASSSGTVLTQKLSTH
ncbi:MAG TPA: tetratricopeptide repeat protein [Terriglobales bacterium]|jgi:DNA-binding winged helix-turn-helix (wHTH) protein/tetratricopeptide (TPR) repeat protein